MATKYFMTSPVKVCGQADCPAFTIQSNGRTGIRQVDQEISGRCRVEGVRTGSHAISAESTCPVAPSNDRDTLPGRLQRRCNGKSRHAGPVNFVGFRQASSRACLRRRETKSGRQWKSTFLEKS